VSGAVAGDEWVHRLLRPRCFPHETAELRLLQTHISWVILTGDFAYKLKKPVHFPFVDFSTAERREQACHDEVRLNRRWSERIYLEVVPVTGTREEPVVGGPGPVLDHAVKMRQFDQDRLLAACLEDGELTAPQLEAFALELARFHQRAASARGTEFGDPSAVRWAVLENFEVLGEKGLDPQDLARKDQVRDFCVRWLADRETLLRERLEAGFVREGHGDMHLGNMLLLGGRVELFDCLEFNARLRWIDVMSEIAFLVMDLEHHGRRDLARRFLNAYVEHSGDHGGLRLLPFYVAYRAMVRAKVDQLQRLDPEQDRAGRRALLAELERYLGVASAWARPARPRLAVLSGLSGSGKTHHARRFVDAGFLRLRSDFERKRLAGSELDVPVQGPAAAPAPGGEADGLYTQEFTQRTYEALCKRAAACLAAGFSVVVDATCLARWQRELFAGLARKRQVPWRLFVLEHETAVLERRIRERARRAQDLSDADVAVLHAQLAAREPLGNDERDAATVVDLRLDGAEDLMLDWLAENPERGSSV
jgi:aminoglycoside phosphotransferase family enzyme/predicted kinase